MSNKFTTNKNAIADCDVCGFQFKLKTLKSLFVRTTQTNILACTECWNPDQPQNLPLHHHLSTTSTSSVSDTDEDPDAWVASRPASFGLNQSLD